MRPPRSFAHVSPDRGLRASLWLLALLIVPSAALAAGGAGQAAPDAYGRSAADLAMEDFLATAPIVRIEDVGEGITRPQRLTLERDGEQHRAIFKSVDVETDGVTRADRLERGFSDRYAYEVAAYRLDRLTGIGLVPVTVVRTVNGETGSVQLWIEDVTTLQKAMQDPNARVASSELLVERLGLMYVLDALIYNVDRNFGNVLVDLERDVFYPIDHSRSFRLSPRPPKSNRGTVEALQLPERVDRRLRAFDLDDLHHLVGGLLEESQVRAVIQRRDRLVKMLDKRSA
jgi:hypothetical protein